MRCCPPASSCSKRSFARTSPACWKSRATARVFARTAKRTRWSTSPRLEVGMGIVKHKCATFAEAEMLALGGARDVFLAYNLVGPNLARAVRYRKRFPDVPPRRRRRPSGPGRSPEPTRWHARGERVHVFVDVDTGLRRTGLAPGPEAHDLYARIHDSSHLDPAGLHLYERSEPPGRPRRTPARRRPMLGRGAGPPRAARRLVASRSLRSSRGAPARSPSMRASASRAWS